jgi:hypothetical protein
VFEHHFTSVLFDCRQVADDLVENRAANRKWLCRSEVARQAQPLVRKAWPMLLDAATFAPQQPSSGKQSSPGEYGNPGTL